MNEQMNKGATENRVVQIIEFFLLYHCYHQKNSSRLSCLLSVNAIGHFTLSHLIFKNHMADIIIPALKTRKLRHPEINSFAKVFQLPLKQGLNFLTWFITPISSFFLS